MKAKLLHPNSFPPTPKDLTKGTVFLSEAGDLCMKLDSGGMVVLGNGITLPEDSFYMDRPITRIVSGVFVEDGAENK